MSSFADASRTLDGISATELEIRLGLPRVALFAEVGSTLDVAHELARQGASAGTLVVADEQTAGRGRHGRRWTSPPGAGLWLTLIERPADVRALDVLSLRIGLAAAASVDALAGAKIRLKWPNDLYVGDRKLAGILLETRWRGGVPDWVAIGFGLNVIAPDIVTAIGLAPGTTRLEALLRVIPALREASAASGHLTSSELTAWRERDLAVGRETLEPAAGLVQGITAAGELLLAAGGRVSAYRSGSLTFAAAPSCS